MLRCARCCLPTTGIRDHYVQSVELKFNCFFLMPMIDAFPNRLREELEQAYEEDLDEVRWGCWAAWGPWLGWALCCCACWHGAWG